MDFRLKVAVFSSALLLGLVEEVNCSNSCHRRFQCGGFFRDPLPADFGVKGDDAPHCGGGYYYQLSCEQNNQTLLYIGSNKHFYVKVEDNTKKEIRFRLFDPGVQKKNCSSFPLWSFDSYGLYSWEKDMMIFVNCKRPVKSPKYIDTAPCHRIISSESSYYSYVVLGKASGFVASEIEETCTIYRSIVSHFPSLYDDSGISRNSNISFRDIHDAIAAGYVFSIYYYTWLDNLVIAGPAVVSFIIVRAIIGSIVFFAFLIYKCRRRHLSIYNAIEEFLQHRSHMVPIRYSYRQIKKITNNFKEKLGEGGYGSVYKGKLRSGQLVAVKMLTKSEANSGKDFINEVATLGRIRHVNVVRLVGFCATASNSKNALIYDYMPNGSLDKFIFGEESKENANLKWKKINEIALGVARGIAYLHEGCNMQILHFDIKPHNILLDENLVPKVSDFGLAKLRQVKNDVVTMTDVRGTIGYMAPELFYKRVGHVSYKADVYSFGMLLMEMAGRRRNLNADADHSSQIYFPTWVHDQLEKENQEELDCLYTEFVEAEGEEKGIAKKLMLVALWCIQMTPNDRPSMKEVVEMLQADASKSLPILSPRPEFYPPDDLPENTLGFVVHDELTESFPGPLSLEIEKID